MTGKTPRQGVREDGRDPRNTSAAHARRRAEEHAAASGRQLRAASRDSAWRIPSAIAQGREQSAVSEERTPAAVHDTEAAQGHDRGGDPAVRGARRAGSGRISRREARRWWWNRTLLRPYFLGVGEIRRRLPTVRFPTGIR